MEDVAFIIVVDINNFMKKLMSRTLKQTQVDVSLLKWNTCISDDTLSRTQYRYEITYHCVLVSSAFV